MRIGKNKCNICDKETEDYYVIPGWINIEIVTITICKGCEKGGNSRTRYQRYEDGALDFCSEKCFFKFFGKLFKEKAN